MDDGPDYGYQSWNVGFNGEDDEQPDEVADLENGPSYLDVPYIPEDYGERDQLDYPHNQPLLP